MVWKSLTLEDLTSLLDLLSASAEMGTVSPGTKAVLGRVSVAEMGPLLKGQWDNLHIQCLPDDMSPSNVKKQLSHV